MALLLPLARTILKYALFYHENREFTENSEHSHNFVYVQRLFEYPAEIRKMIYTTNAIESFNSALRKVTDRKAAFPNEMAVMKILYLRTLDVVKKWTMPYPNWSLIRGKLDFLWGMGWEIM